MTLTLDPLIQSGDRGLKLQDLKGEEAKIAPFLNRFEAWKQDFHLLPKVKGPVLAVKELANSLKGKYPNVVTLGIGGSALGVTCLRDALKGPYWNHYGKPRLFVLDNLDLLSELEKVVKLEETLFIVISKSGATTETLAQFSYFREKVSKEQFVFITDPTQGELRKIGREYHIPLLDIPPNVGGRFSVLSPVGLFPAALLGIEIEELLRGAEAMANLFKSHEFDLNLPFQFAAVQYLLEWKQGIAMTVLMPYSTRLLSLADWYAQLLAESVGKAGKGLTPLRALGVTDQHSQLQLWSEGPKDKLVVFIEVEKLDPPFHELMKVEKHATEEALSQYGRPTLTIKVPEVNPYELGQVLMFFMCSVAFLGEYYSINAYDQPGVELSKKLTLDLLSP